MKRPVDSKLASVDAPHGEHEKGPAASRAVATEAPAAPASGEPDTTAHALLALADPLRLRMLRLLERQELSVGEVAAVFQLPQSTASRQLKALASAGWIAKRSEGPATLYRHVGPALEPNLRGLWLAARNRLGRSAELLEDDRRLASVLAERSEDSLAYFGRVAGEWDHIRRDLFGRGFTAEALLALLDPAWTVADLGCGTGNVAERLAPFVGRLIAVDQSTPMLEAARKRLDRFGKVEFLQGPLEALPLSDACLDAAVCALVLHHLEEPGRALCEIARTLKPGGVALVIDMARHNRTEYLATMGHKRLGFADEEIAGSLADAGFVGARVVHLDDQPQGKGPGLFVATARKPAALGASEVLDQ